ncbi:hypothetical protein AB0L13_43840 [Saccharopolyspora shandongensis]|uniref:hypothetical protein n=1 Tax=Saccharopolyspora shandongensis TaxID=418495 RepID=UPI00344132B3
MGLLIVGGVGPSKSDREGDDEVVEIWPVDLGGLATSRHFSGSRRSRTFDAAVHFGLGLQRPGLESHIQAI